MFGFSGSSSSSSNESTPSSFLTGQASDSTTKAEKIKQDILQQVALANAQELINKINEKCYARCITNPSTSISAREQRLISNCMDRYLEAYNIVSKTYVDRITKERNQAALAAASSASKGLDVLDGSNSMGLNSEGFK